MTDTSFYSTHIPDKLIEFNKILKRENSNMYRPASLGELQVLLNTVIAFLSSTVALHSGSSFCWLSLLCLYRKQTKSIRWWILAQMSFSGCVPLTSTSTSDRNNINSHEVLLTMIILACPVWFFHPIRLTFYCF